MIYPTQVKEEAKKYLEACLNYFMESDFASAFKNLETCYNIWTDNESEILTPENQIFIEFFKGMIYLSAGRDDMALNSFYHSKSIGEKLSWSNPDRALPFAGLGNVLFRMEEY